MAIGAAAIRQQRQLPPEEPPLALTVVVAGLDCKAIHGQRVEAAATMLA